MYNLPIFVRAGLLPLKISANVTQVTISKGPVRSQTTLFLGCH